MTQTLIPSRSRTRPLLIAASVPSALSLAWTAWSVADMIPAPWPVAIAAGVALDVALVAAVAIAWVAPAIARGAQIASWIIAGVAAAAIAIHSWHISPALALMAAVPLIAKALWSLALGAKAAAEQVEQEAAAAERAEAEADDAALSVEQRRQIAAVRRETAFARAMAEARAEQEQAAIMAANRVAMARDAAEAERLRSRYELAAQVGGQLPLPVLAQIMPSLAEVAPGPAIESGGSKKASAPARDRRIAAAARQGIEDLADWLNHIEPEDGDEDGDGQGGPEGSGPSPAGTGPAVRSSAQEAEHNRRQVAAVIRELGPGVSTSEISRRTGLSTRTVARHRAALTQ